ncbi:hypothetical protein HY441_02370 [Candidatus Microgenomates bacterium]|nr:hypothetical protein [Candidatus Microgenomates bacterium]
MAINSLSAGEDARKDRPASFEQVLEERPEAVLKAYARQCLGITHESGGAKTRYTMAGRFVAGESHRLVQFGLDWNLIDPKEKCAYTLITMPIDSTTSLPDPSQGEIWRVALSSSSRYFLPIEKRRLTASKNTANVVQVTLGAFVNELAKLFGPVDLDRYQAT